MRRTWRKPSHLSPPAWSPDKRRVAVPPILAHETIASLGPFWPILAPSGHILRRGHLFWNELSILYETVPPLTDESLSLESQLLFTSCLPHLFFGESGKFHEVRPQKISCILRKLSFDIYIDYVLKTFRKHALWDWIVDLNVVSICVQGDWRSKLKTEATLRLISTPQTYSDLRILKRVSVRKCVFWGKLIAPFCMKI